MTTTTQRPDLVALVREQGKCAGSPTPDAWFGDDAVVFDLAQAEADARALCSGCPVITACLTLALARGEEFGVWGGTAPHERADLAPTTTRRRRRDGPRPLAPAAHGVQLLLWEHGDAA